MQFTFDLLWFWWLCWRVVHWGELLPHFNFEVQYPVPAACLFLYALLKLKLLSFPPLWPSYNSNLQSWFQLSSVWLKNRSQCNATISTFPGTFKCNKRILAKRLGNLWRIVIYFDLIFSSYFCPLWQPQDFLAKQEMQMNIFGYPARFSCKAANAQERISSKTWMGNTINLFLCSGVGWLYQKIQNIQVVKFSILLLFQLQYWQSPGDPCFFSGLWRIVDQAKMFSEGLGAGNTGRFVSGFCLCFSNCEFFPLLATWSLLLQHSHAAGPVFCSTKSAFSLHLPNRTLIIRLNLGSKK